MKVKFNIKFFIMILFTIIILLKMSTVSLASGGNTASITLTSNSNIIKEGQTITVNVNLTSINAGNGIDAVVAQLNYDKNVFELVSSNDFSSNTNWVVSFSAGTNMLTAHRDNKVKNPGNIFSIKLRAKSNFNNTSTNIKLQNIVVSGGSIRNGGTGDINVNNASITLKKLQEAIPPVNYSAAIALKSNSTLKEGEIIDINVYLTNVNAGNGIDVVVAQLNYDKNVFELVSSNNFSSNTNWVVSFSTSTNMLTAHRNNKVKNPGNIFSIKLRVKSNFNNTSTNIKLQNIVVSGGTIKSGGTGDINVNNASITFKKNINEKVIVTSTDKSNTNIYKNSINGVLAKSIDNIEDTEIDEEIKDVQEQEDEVPTISNSESSKKDKPLYQESKNNEEETINKVNVIIGSVSSVSFVSICAYLFKSLKFSM